jgi:citrate synthase
VPFEQVADRLWQATSAKADDAWRASVTPGRPAVPLPPGIPVLHRFAVAVAAYTSPAAASPDWPLSGRRAIGCLIDASGPDPIGPDPTGDETGSVAQRLWRRWSPLPPTSERVRAVNLALVLLAEHELALSTLSVRVAASARAAPASCLLAGLSTLSGSLHGGAAAAVHDKLAAGEPVVTGFGHPVHRHGDPRVAPLLDAVYAFAGDAHHALIETARRQAPPPLNVDFALGALTVAARMPAEAATAIFAVARVAGWIAHAAEEYQEPPLRFRGRAVNPVRPVDRPSRSTPLYRTDPALRPYSTGLAPPSRLTADPVTYDDRSDSR